MYAAACAAAFCVPLVATAAEPALKTIRVLTFNAAGIPVVHPEMTKRVAAAGRAVADGGYDLVGLQEMWRDKDSAALAEASGLRYVARNHRRYAIHSGLSILSRWPILMKEERAFSSVRPSLRHLSQGEALVSKGFLFARVATPWGELDAYAAHTLADYPEAQYHLLRMTELFELSEGVRELSGNRPFVILGDLNSGRGDREYDVFLDLLGLRDLCERKGREQCPDADHTPRIDHILVPGELAATGRKVLDAPIDQTGLMLSDHPGLAADVPRALMSLRARPDAQRRAAALIAVEEAVGAAIERLEAQRRRTGWIPIYGSFLAARYARQSGRLSVIRERAATARAALKL